MSNNLHLLGQLKNKLSNEQNFNEVMKFFFDHFAESDGFMRLGKVHHSAMVENIVAEAASAALWERVTVREMRLTRLAEQQFCHGPCFVNGRIATLFYFEDIRTGLLAISMGRGGEMRYTRITAVAVIKDDQSAKWN